MAERLAAVLETEGPAAVVALRGGGSLGLSKELICHFWNSLGPVTTVRGGLCGEAGEAAQCADFGDAAGHDYTDLANSAAVVLWGKNPVATGRHLVPFIKDARQRGAPIYLVETRPTESERLADRVIRVTPGGDGFLALGVLHVLYHARALRRDMLERTENWAAFEAMLRGTAPALAQCVERAGVARADIEALAALYADYRPVATWVGWGLQRRRLGGRNLRYIDALGLLSGNVGVKGGGVNFTSRRRRGLRVEGLASASGRSLSAPNLARGLCALDDPPARFVYIAAANPVTQHPDSRSLRRVLRSLPFVVVADAFFTDTAEAADLVLPTTLMLEEEDVVGSYQHHYVARAHKVVEPPPEARGDLWILRELGRRLGRPEDPLLSSPQEAVSRLVEAWFPDSDRPYARNPAHVEIPFSGVFPTPSGKARLVDVPPRPVGEEAGFPLVFLTPSSRGWQTSQIPEAEQSAPASCMVHPEAAAAAGVADGDVARVVSSLGQLRVTVRVHADVHPQACVVPRGGWIRHGRGVNALVQAAATDLGEGAALYDQRVRLEPAGDSSNP